MGKRIKPWKDVRTAGDVKNYAEGRGARIHRAGSGEEWDEIRTPKGRMSITSNDRQEFDKDTLGNTKRWLKLMGLMVLVAVMIYLFL